MTPEIERLRGENRILQKQVAWLAHFLDEYCEYRLCLNCNTCKFCPRGYCLEGIEVSGFADVSRKIAEEQS